MFKKVSLFIAAVTLALLPGILHAQWVNNGMGVCTADSTQYQPKMVTDGYGGAIIAWRDGRNNSNFDFYAQRINSLGVMQWTTNGVPVCVDANIQSKPTMVADGVGGAILAWEDRRNGIGNYDIYAQRIDSLGAAQWLANGVAFCTADSEQRKPDVVTDDSEGCIITWTDYRNGYNNGDIYAQRVNANGVAQWSNNGVAICTIDSTQVNPIMVSDGFGGAIISWKDCRNGSDGDIYAQKIDAPGSVQWAVNGVTICTADSIQYLSDIASDGSGGAIITWGDYRNGNYDIYSQRINSSGITQWTANGVAVCTADSTQDYPKITSDGSGGAIITWQDRRSGNYDIYSQRINSSGVTQWTTNGIAICTAYNGYSSLDIVSDGSGGAIIAWRDYRNGNYDIYSQRINSSGVTQWIANGVAVSTADSTQDYPKIIADGSAGVIIVWPDYRNYSSTNRDIYAQRVNADGSVGVAGNRPETSISSGYYLNTYPNPFGRITNIKYQIAKSGQVSLKVYNIAGQAVRTLVNEDKKIGSYEVVWNGRDESGRQVASGVYFYKINAGEFSDMKKLIILR